MKILGRTFFENKPIVNTPIADIQNFNKRSPKVDITPLQLTRIQQDINKWRRAIQEAESIYTPQRIQLYRLYKDVVDDAQINGCFEKRKDNIKLMKFSVCNKSEKIDEEMTTILESQWFIDFIDLAMDSILYGHSLIQLGDIINDAYPEICLVPRENVKPELGIYTELAGGLTGTYYLDQPYKNWLISVGKKTDLGLLEKLSPYYIWKKNAMGAFSEYTTIFGSPIRVGKTNVINKEARDNMSNMMINMGIAPWAVVGLEDVVELIESSGDSAKGTHDVLIDICDKAISKIILGHSSAIDSTSGKLGNEDGANESVEMKKQKDMIFMEHIVNDLLLPAMANVGFPVKPTDYFEFCNDEEEVEAMAEQRKIMLEVATYCKTFKEAGISIPIEYISEVTGVDLEIQPESPSEDLTDTNGENNIIE